MQQPASKPKLPGEPTILRNSQLSIHHKVHGLFLQRKDREREGNDWNRAVEQTFEMQKLG